MGKCLPNTTIVLDETPLQCDEFINSDCVLYMNAISYLNLPTQSTVTEIVSALLTSLIDTRGRLENVENNSINEAPIDGNQYGRQDGTWTEISESGSTIIEAGDDIEITGIGTENEPYVINSLGSSQDLQSVIDNNNEAIGSIRLETPTIGLTEYFGTNIRNYVEGEIDVTLLFREGAHTDGIQFSLPSSKPEGEYIIATTEDIPVVSYKVWTGTLNQIATGNPTETVLENTIGSIVWTTVGVGTYFGTLTGAFPANKTHLSITPSSPTASYSIFRNTDDIIVIKTQDNSTVPFTDSNDKLFNNSIRIEVYP